MEWDWMKFFGGVFMFASIAIASGNAARAIVAVFCMMLGLSYLDEVWK